LFYDARVGEPTTALVRELVALRKAHGASRVAIETGALTTTLEIADGRSWGCVRPGPAIRSGAS